MKTATILLLFTFLLGGCAQLPKPQKISWLPHQQQLEKLSSWSLTGKVAFITPEERHSLNIYWAQSQDEFHITLTTFLGATVLDIKKTQLGTQIIDNKGKYFFSRNTDALIKQLSGLTIPVEALQQWIKGNPKNATYQLNNGNQVASLISLTPKKSPWFIDYQEYKKTQGVSLPYKLQLKRSDLRLKFAISHWRLNQEAL